jgi:syntaxin 16
MQPTRLTQATAMHETANMAARIRQVEELASSIKEMADLFRSLSALVIDQGTLLDRVDYNVEQLTVHVQGAAQELLTASKHQQSQHKRSCIILLLFLVLAVTAALLVKSNR